MNEDIDTGPYGPNPDKAAVLEDVTNRKVHKKVVKRRRGQRRGGEGGPFVWLLLGRRSPALAERPGSMLAGAPQEYSRRR